MSFEEAIELVAKGIDVVGVAVIVGGIAVATLILWSDLRRRSPDRDP